MKVLVIGNGGREHALAWKLAQSPKISLIYVAPGNAGTALNPDMKNVPITDIAELLEFAEKEQIGLTIVGPEAPLSLGVVDTFRAAGLKIFGPTKAAAQLESSKDFAKAFMLRHNIPTAAYATFTDAAAAHDYVRKQGAPLATSQDHKRLLDGDQGPNTGGMGAYSPAPVVTPEVHAKVMREIIKPTVAGMEKDGIPYTGFLYAGLMISPSGEVKTLEFNCRMGDPETQPIMLRLKSDLLTLAEHTVDGTLDKVEAEWDRRTALGVVMAAANYPDNPRTGDVISGLPKDLQDAYVFHAGTTLKDGEVATSGGRVLCVTALGETVKYAQSRAYQIADEIKFEGSQMRKDIGYRAIKS